MKVRKSIYSALALVALSCLALSPQAQAACQEGCLANSNTALGKDALINATGSQNTANGYQALFSNTIGNSNTATGWGDIVDGNNNTCVGFSAGIGIVHASNSIAIGAPATGPFADSDNTCFIGSINGEPTSDPGSTVQVLIDSNNVLGTSVSSRRFKHDIKAMDKASETLLSLKPVSFKYNHDVKGSTQYGLIAEEVAQVDRRLAVYRDGQPYTVKYDQINVMLLNEFLKEHRKVEQLQTEVAALTSGLQKVRAQLELHKTAPQTVANSQ